MTDERHGEANDVVDGAEPIDPLAEPTAADNGEEREAKRKRNRAKLSLRIPDDEVARPEPTAPPVAAREPRPEDLDMKPIVPMRIVDLASQPPPPVDDAPTPMANPVVVKPTSSPDESWTPFQPTTVDAAEAKQSTPSSDDIDVPIDMDDVPASDVEKTQQMQAIQMPSASISSEDIVVDEPTERVLSGMTTSSSGPPPAPDTTPLLHIPRAPLTPNVSVPTSPSPRESIETRAPINTPAPMVEPKPSRPPAAALVDDEEAIPEVEPDTSEPNSTRGGDEELAAEDLMSVENAPKRKSSPPPSTKADKAQPPPLAKTPLVIVPPSIAAPSGLAPPAVTSDAAQKRKGRLWWEELFGDDFIRTMAKITDEQIAAEVDFIEDSLGVAKGGTMLDLACGTGRHAIELARRGYQVVGFDLSLAMLARAAEEAQERDQKINFVQGDMREMTFENTFDGVYCWNTSFGFFEEEKNAIVCGKVHKSLRAGGQFLLDVVNRDFIVQQSPSLVWFEGDGCICMDEMQVDWITSRMRVKRTMMLDDGRTKEIEYSIRVYSLHELGKLLHDQGFRIAEVSGRTATPGVFFGGASPRTLILAEKK